MADAPNVVSPRKKKRNLVLDWLVYAALRVMVWAMQVLPASVNLTVARCLGRGLWRAYPEGRRRAVENLQASFPEKDLAWVLQTGQRSFEHIAMMGADLLMTPLRVRKDNWRQYSRYSACERTKWMMKEGRGLLLVTGHYGNFEIAGYLFGLFGFNIQTVARPLDNRFVDRYVRSIREHRGQRIIDKKGASDLMLEAPERGVSLGLVADQDAGKKGVFVDFLGRKASTFKSIALLAATKNMPVAVGYSRRVGNRFFFDIGVNRIIFPEEWSDKADPITWITAEYTRAIEQFVREDPSQYWWVHRRWKTRPKKPCDEPGSARTESPGHHLT